MALSVWSIKYYSKLTGEDRYYMDVGFSSKMEAERELKLIMRDRNRYSMSDEEIQEQVRKGFWVPTACIGENFQIVERKVRSK